MSPTPDEGSVHWQRNLYVCVFGSFTTIMVLPFLPLYVQQLGATSVDVTMQWSGIAFGATFLAAGLAAGSRTVSDASRS